MRSHLRPGPKTEAQDLPFKSGSPEVFEVLSVVVVIGGRGGAEKQAWIIDVPRAACREKQDECAYVWSPPSFALQLRGDSQGILNGRPASCTSSFPSASVVSARSETLQAPKTFDCHARSFFRSVKDKRKKRLTAPAHPRQASRPHRLC